MTYVKKYACYFNYILNNLIQITYPLFIIKWLPLYIIKYTISQLNDYNYKRLLNNTLVCDITLSY